MFHLGLRTLQPLFSAHWPIVGPCVNHHLSKKKLLWWRLRDAVIYGYNKKVWSLFNAVFIYQDNSSRFSPRIYDLGPQVFGPNSGTSYYFLLWIGPYIWSESVGYSLDVVSLFHQWISLALPSIIVAHRVIALPKLASRNGAPRLISLCLMT